MKENPHLRIYTVPHEPLQRHHKIHRCFGKIFKHSKALLETIKSPSNIQMVTPEEHKILDKDTPQLFYFLKKEFGNGYREKTIPREEIIFKR